MAILGKKTLIIRLIDPLPCSTYSGWAYCEKPATTAIAELVATAHGRTWSLRPFCEAHAPVKARK